MAVHAEADFHSPDHEAGTMTGTVAFRGKTVELTLAMAKERIGESGPDAYARELADLRDALHEILTPPNKVKL